MRAHYKTETDRADDAIAKRLARLRQRPLHMRGLQRRARQAIAERAERRPLMPFRRWIGPLNAMAASLLLAGIVVAVVLMMRGSAVLASPVELSRIHQANISGEASAGVAASFESAEQYLARQWEQCPRLPDTPFISVTSCHVHRLAGKRIACVAGIVDGRPVTLAAAHATDMRLPRAPSVSRNGVEYRVQSSGGVNIVIAHRDGLWLCLMGELPVERLVEVAASLRV